jgi:hypothetical protein
LLAQLIKKSNFLNESTEQVSKINLFAIHALLPLAQRLEEAAAQDPIIYFRASGPRLYAPGKRDGARLHRVAGANPGTEIRHEIGN